MTDLKWPDHRKIDRLVTDQRRLDVLLYPILVERRTEAREMPSAIHLSNHVIGGYYEESRELVLDRLGYLAVDTPFHSLMVQSTLRYFAELTHPLTLRVGSGIAWVGRSSFVLAQGLFVGEQCVGLSDAVLVNAAVGEHGKVGRASPFTPDVESRLNALSLRD